MTNAQRILVGASGLVVAVLAGVFAYLGLERANQLAGVLSALVGVLALAVAVWALLPGRAPAVRVRNTGAATARGDGLANTGVTGPARGPVEVADTGDAQSERGQANTGYSG